MKTETARAGICEIGGERPLTVGEVNLARTIFGDEINYPQVRIKRRKWFPFQPVRMVMAPHGHLHFHPHSDDYCEDFSQVDLSRQGLLVHELVHVWQAQKYGWWYLPIVRPFSRRYDYRLKPGWELERYGIEQQAEIVRHAFMLRNGVRLAGLADVSAYDSLVKFTGATAIARNN